jgi:ubiquinone biosynthesis protein COQ9
MPIESKEKLIKAALRDIAFEGWTQLALEKAEKAGGFSPGTYAAHFPGGIQDFITAFHGWVDGKMTAALAADAEFGQAKIREKIFRAVMARITAMKPYRESVRRLIGHQLLPWNGPLALRQLGRAADAMWKAAGDRSVDYNYYTKRLLLAGVYASTLQRWIADESEGFTDTQQFLRERIEDVLRFGKMIGGIKERFGRKAA